MDQIVIGNFIKELRREKGITQEQLAEVMNTSRRTVSRWETGANMPDLDLIPELASYFSVGIDELFSGRRNSSVKDRVSDAVLQAADYSNTQKQKAAKTLFIYFISGLISLVIHEILVMTDLPETFIVGFLKGASFGLSLCAMVMGLLYSIWLCSSISDAKKRILTKYQNSDNC